MVKLVNEMMTTRLKPRDWETLSAYLDGQLTPRENARLEARLQADVDMRNSLEQLRRTRVVLRSLPKLRSPRNYTLSPSRVRRTNMSTSKVYPALRLASAMAMFLFVLVVIGDFLTPVQKGASISPMAGKVSATQEVMLEVAPAPTQAPAMVAAIPEMTEDVSVLKSQSASEIITATVGISEAVGMGGGSTEETPLAGARNDTVQPSATPAALATYPPPAALQDTPIIATTPQIEIPVLIGKQPVPENKPTLNIWRVSEFALVVLAVITGLAALFIRRKA